MPAPMTFIFRSGYAFVMAFDIRLMYPLGLIPAAVIESPRKISVSFSLRD